MRNFNNLEVLKIVEEIYKKGGYALHGKIIKFPVPTNTVFTNWIRKITNDNTKVHVNVECCDSLYCANKIRKSGITDKILVLNFANPFTPGGGTRSGCNAQEEDLCRKSNLLMMLEDESASYYYKTNLDKSKYSNGFETCILTENVTVFMDEMYNLLDEPFLVDIITAAAPFNKSSITGLSQQDELESSYGSMKNICEMILSIAKRYEYKYIVLGAFGCGVFGNDPYDVANIFKSLLNNYRIENVFFPILVRNQRDENNFNTFSEVFKNN